MDESKLLEEVSKLRKRAYALDGEVFDPCAVVGLCKAYERLIELALMEAATELWLQGWRSYGSDPDPRNWLWVPPEV